jgi:hypothetical protein
MITLRVVTLLIGVTLAGVAPFGAAHTEEYFDSKESLHGGQTRMAGPYHLELVARDKEIILYVMDHADQALSTAGGAGKATVQVAKAKAKTPVRLEPKGNNVLKGTGDFIVTSDTVVTVFVELPGQEVTPARFVPLKPKAKLAMKNKNIEPQEAESSDGYHHHAQH